MPDIQATLSRPTSAADSFKSPKYRIPTPIVREHFVRHCPICDHNIGVIMLRISIPFVTNELRNIYTGSDGLQNCSTN